MNPQDKWKLEAPTDSGWQVKKRIDGTFNWCPYHKIWTFHKTDGWGIVHYKIKKPKVNKGQHYSSKRQVKHFVIALNMIMIKIDRKSSSIRNDHLKGVKDNGSALLYLSWTSLWLEIISSFSSPPHLK